ncbi:MAG: nucleotidyltransferase domain-containing protein [Nitrospirae bacterium]|nr:nucleotidyltransferase domain-containing protein [Nitrospirota bacterium]MBI3393928.1 nucleotidyltransferase domain-containing protein [Nitrospirota bacterium]
MRVHNVLELIFGSPARIRILRVLASIPRPLSGRQVGELAGLTHRGAIHALASLVDIGAVKQRRAGNAYQYSLSKGSIFAEKIVLPAIKAEGRLLDELKRDVAARFGHFTVSLVLYGSLARGEEKEGSDIDVMAVVKGEREKAAMEEKAASMAFYFSERFDGLLSIHCLTVDEIRRRKDLPLMRSVMKEGVILAGKRLSEWAG